MIHGMARPTVAYVKRSFLMGKHVMYGFVNLAIRDFVIQNHGPQCWNQIKSDVCGNVEICLPDKVYDDSFTYGIVAAIADKLNITVPTALEAFGEYWVSFVDNQGYGAMLSGNGRTFKEFLSNLDQFHSRLGTTYAEFDPPYFEFVDHGENQLELNYTSKRPGLAHMVSGILKGLAKRYDTEIELVADCQKFQGKFEIVIVNHPANSL